MDNPNLVHPPNGQANAPHEVPETAVRFNAFRPGTQPVIDIHADGRPGYPFEHEPSCGFVNCVDGGNAEAFALALGEDAGFGEDAVAGESVVENGVSPGFRGAVFQCAGQIGGEVCGFVEASFGALGDEQGRS